MSATTPPLPPNPSLLAILLIVRTKAGQPRLVFHHPLSTSVSSRTQPAPPAHASWFGGASTGAEGDESSTEHSSDTDDDARSDLASRVGSDAGHEEERRSKSGSWRSRSRGHTVGTGSRSTARPGGGRDIDDELEAGSGDDEDLGAVGDELGTGGRAANGARGDGSLGWERVLGFEAGALSKMLTPSRAFNKRRFEVGIDNLVFLGAPMFVRDDGSWKKAKKMKSKGGKRSAQDGMTSGPQSPSRVNGGTAPMDLPPKVETEHESIVGSALTSSVPSEAPSLSEDSEMSMFHVIFVMNPPVLEHHLRVDDMYEHVAKWYAKFLKHEQAAQALVSNESRKILALKEKARESGAPGYMLWPNIIAASPLAKSMVMLFDAVSESKIAHIHFDNTLDVPFQIPQPEFTPFISTTTEPQVPGLWLTTTPFITDDESNAILSPHSALLLLQDNEVLIREIESESKKLAEPLTWFINNLTPTKSLQKQFTRSSMTLKDALFLADHLIEWRRARAVPPLHHRDTYIVSPNADLRALPVAITAFATRFPNLPPLPRILQLLSGQPRPYYLLMPSKDHRTAFMEILAWLMRGGWITQLKSFGWVSVPVRVKTAVAQKMAAERAARLQPTGKLDKASIAALDGASSASHRTKGSVSTITITESPASSNAPSPRLSAYRPPSHPASEAGSTSSERTTVPYRVSSPSPPHHSTQPVRPSPLHMEQQPSPSPANEKSAYVSPAVSLQSSQLDGPHAGMDLGAPTPSVIRSPQKANAIESRWIEHIGSSFTDAELTELWPVVLRYLDGKHALDEIALREGLKRKRVAGVVAKLREQGVLLTVRHW